MTPEETVRYYYAQWSRRSTAGMNAVVYAPLRFTDDFSGMIWIKLLTCEEIDDSALAGGF